MTDYLFQRAYFPPSRPALPLKMVFLIGASPAIYDTRTMERASDLLEFSFLQDLKCPQPGLYSILDVSPPVNIGYD